MKPKMFLIVSKQHKIFNAIIRTVTIYMMNYFYRFKITPKIFFHDETMFKDMVALAIWMIGLININITMMLFYSTFPPITFRSTTSLSYSFFVNFRKRLSLYAHASLADFISKGFRHLFTFIPGFHNSFCSFIPRYTSFWSAHRYPLIKKAAFGGLKKTAMFSHLLTAKFFDIKNPFSLSNYSISQIKLLSIGDKHGN